MLPWLHGVATLRIPITHYCHEVKERRGLGIVVMEETMETRVAKGTALNSEGRNEKWGGTLSGLKGRSLFQDVTLGDYSKGLGTWHLPPTQREAGVQEFQRPRTTIRPTPSSLDLPGERQSKCTGPTHTTQSGCLWTLLLLPLLCQAG